MEREEFLNQYKRKVVPVVPIEEDRRFNEKMGINQERYSAPKGTMSKAKARRRVVRTRIASLILSAAIGAGGLTAVGHRLVGDKDKQIQSTEMSAMKLGMGEETLSQLEKYNEYFENLDKNTLFSEEEVFKIIQEIENLNYDVIKEKMGYLLNEDKSDIELYYRFEKADGTTYTAITVNKDDPTKRKIFSNDRILALPDKNTIPKDIENGIKQIEEYDNIRNDLISDKISKVNSVRKLKKLYKNIENIASGELLRDEKGNITFVKFDTSKQRGEER